MSASQPNDSVSFESRWLLLPKLLYFWLNMAIYTASSFIAKFFIKKWKMEEYQIAFMMSLQVTIFFGAMFWTNLADRIRQPRKILMIAIVGYALSFCCLGLPVFPGKEQGYHRLVFTSIVLSFTWMFSSCFYPIVDSTIMMLLEQDPNFTKDHYNNQRLWGVPAHVLGNIVSGWAMTRFGIIGYEITVFISTVIFAAVAFITMPSKMIESSSMAFDKAEKGGDGKETKSAANPTWMLLSDFNFLFFLIFGLSAGLLRSTLTNFQTHHVEKTYKTDSFWAALTCIPRIASEVAVYLTAKRLSKWCGVYWMLFLSQVAGLIRVFGYAFAPTHGNWHYLPFLLEIPKGINSGLLVTSSVRIASDIAPSGCATSAQGLFSGTYTGLSMFIGGIVNGLLLYYSDNNLTFMFKWVGLFSALCTTGLFIKYVFYDKLITLPFTRKHN